MMVLALAVLSTPFCATIAGIVIWASHRHESLDDAALLRNFLFVLILGMMLVWGGSRTDTVRMRLDPQFRIQTEIEANPVYATVEQYAPDDAKPLREFLGAQMARGGTLSQALLQARPLLTSLANYRLGFTDQESRLSWGRLVADTLKELRARDPVLCYRVIAAQTLDQQTLAQAYSVANTEAFQQAVVRIYESADRGMGGYRLPDEKPADFNQTALEFRAVMDAIDQQFGHAVAAQIARKKLSEPPAAPPEQMCAARIFQLEAMLKRPKATAALLIDSVLR